MTELTAAWRVFDANVNRAAEGLRVVEEYGRFILEDPHLSKLIKQLRHDLTDAIGGSASCLRARDTLGDVGTEIGTAQETQRLSLHDVLASNFSRVQQSLRCLEEYGKLLRPDAASAFESLRYRAYTLERSLVITAMSQSRLADARIYVLMDGGPSVSQFQSLAKCLVAAGADVVQIRDKRLSDRDLLERARLLTGITRPAKTLCIVNDRPDIAQLASADGVHVGQDELTVRDARAIVDDRMLVGVSTHSLAEARRAVLDGADYIGCGPTFPSRTKHFDDFPGTKFLTDVAREISLPAFAIGGISLANLEKVQEAGFQRIAVGTAVTADPDPANAVTQLRENLIDP